MWNEEPPPTDDEDAAEERATRYYEEIYGEFIKGLSAPDSFEVETPAFPFEYATLPRVITEFALADDDCETVREMLALMRDVMASKECASLHTRARHILENLAHRYAAYQTDYRAHAGDFDRPEVDEPADPWR